MDICRLFCELFLPWELLLLGSHGYFPTFKAWALLADPAPLNLRLETNGDSDQGTCWLPPRPGWLAVDVVSHTQPQVVSIIVYHGGVRAAGYLGRQEEKHTQYKNKGRRWLAETSRVLEQEASREMGV